MMKRLVAVTAFGAGYIAGAAAGRERYEQIRKVALRVKDDPHLQHAVDEAADFARQHNPVSANGSATEAFVPSQGTGIGQ
jgi:hypothetical protein